MLLASCIPQQFESDAAPGATALPFPAMQGIPEHLSGQAVVQSAAEGQALIVGLDLETQYRSVDGTLDQVLVLQLETALPAELRYRIPDAEIVIRERSAVVTSRQDGSVLVLYVRGESGGAVLPATKPGAGTMRHTGVGLARRTGAWSLQSFFLPDPAVAELLARHTSLPASTR